MKATAGWSQAYGLCPGGLSCVSWWGPTGWLAYQLQQIFPELLRANSICQIPCMVRRVSLCKRLTSKTEGVFCASYLWSCNKPNNRPLFAKITKNNHSHKSLSMTCLHPISPAPALLHQSRVSPCYDIIWCKIQKNCACKGKKRMSQF